MVTALRWALGGLLAAGLIALLFSFAGRWHPAADTLAVFRPGVALACLPFVALLGRRHWLFWPGLALVLAVLAIRAWDDRPGRGPAPGFTVYQKNMYFGMQDHAPLARHIRAAAPDFVTLQEVTRGNAAMLDVLSDILPSQHVCPFAAVGAVAVASRFPAVSGATLCAEGDGLVAMQVETPEGPVWIVSIHLHWPWPHGQAAQAERLARLLGTLDGPMLIGGDFNMVPWSGALRRIMRASGTARPGPVRPTLRAGYPTPLRLPIAIDHVLGGRDGATAVALRPRLGSDHRGGLARLPAGKDPRALP